MTWQAAAEPEGKPEQESAVKALISVVASVGVPVTVVGALMFYFGWARSDQQASHMGLDVSLFGHTTQDYILRGITTLFLPLLGLGILGLAWLGLHHAIQGWLATPRLHPTLHVVGRVAFVAGLVVAAVALLSAVIRRPAAGLLFGPLAVAVGTAIAGYGLWLARAASGPSRRRIPLGQRALGALFVAAIVGLAMIWELSIYATVIGNNYANAMADHVPLLPRATAISPAPLGVDAPGVHEELIARDPPLYRTTGLRLMVRSGGRMFLLHDGWRPESGRVIVVPDGADVSWQFSR